MSSDVIHYIVRDEKSLIYLAPLLRSAINNNCRYNRVGRYSTKLEKVLYRKKSLLLIQLIDRRLSHPSPLLLSADIFFSPFACGVSDTPKNAQCNQCSDVTKLSSSR